MISVLLIMIPMAIIQPTTLGGYAPQTRVEESVNKTLVTESGEYESGYFLNTSSYTILFNEDGIIIAIGSRIKEDGVFVSELGLKFPCPSKSILEVLGMPDETVDNIYVYEYVIGLRRYKLNVVLEENKATHCLISSHTDLVNYLPHLKK